MKKSNFSVAIILGVLGLVLICFFLISKVSGIQIDVMESKDYIRKTDSGYYGLKALLDKLDLNVQTDISTNFKPENSSLVLYTDFTETDNFLTPDILLWIKKGNTLIIDSRIYNHIFNTEISAVCEEQSLTFIPESLNDISTLTTRLYIDKTKLNIFDNIEIIAESDNGLNMLVGHIGSGSIILVSDISVFNNNLFKDGEIDRAYVLAHLFTLKKYKNIYFREKIRTYKQNPSFLRDMFIGEYSHITIQITLILLLLILYYGKRFIKSSDLVVKKQRRVTEHINAVANLYKKAGATDLVTKIDIEFFKTVICKNNIPLMFDEEKYYQAINEKDFKTGFILREALISKIKRRFK